MNLSKKLTYIVTFIVIFGLLPYGIYKFYYKYQDGLYSGLSEYSTYTTPDGKYTVSLRDTKQFGNEDEVVLKIYLVDGICVFFAVLPIICFITEKKLDYWLSLLAAEVYSFITIFVGNLGTISKLYPLVAAFTLSGYYESTPAEILLSVISMALCGTISGILIYRLSKRDALQ